MKIAKWGLGAALVLATAGSAWAANDAVEKARANIEAYSVVPDFVAPGEAFDARACMEGKSIMTIPSSSAIPFVKTIADHKDELAKELGFKHGQWEN